MARAYLWSNPSSYLRDDNIDDDPSISTSHRTARRLALSSWGGTVVVVVVDAAYSLLLPPPTDANDDIIAGRSVSFQDGGGASFGSVDETRSRISRSSRSAMSRDFSSNGTTSGNDDVDDATA